MNPIQEREEGEEQVEEQEAGEGEDHLHNFRQQWKQELQQGGGAAGAAGAAAAAAGAAAAHRNPVLSNRPNTHARTTRNETTSRLVHKALNLRYI